MLKWPTITRSWLDGLAVIVRGVLERRMLASLDSHDRHLTFHRRELELPCGQGIGVPIHMHVHANKV